MCTRITGVGVGLGRERYSSGQTNAQCSVWGGRRSAIRPIRANKKRQSCLIPPIVVQQSIVWNKITVEVMHGTV